MAWDSVIEAARDAMDNNYREAGRALHALCAPHKGPMGLTSDAFKRTAEYKAAKLDADTAFAALRGFNKRHPRNSFCFSNTTPIA